MEKNLIDEMETKIHQYIERGYFDKKKIVIFGYSHIAEQMIALLSNVNKLVWCIVDNDSRKRGEILQGIEVKSPDTVLIPFDGNLVILIASALHYDEMAEQLRRLGYIREKNVLDVISHNHIQYSSMETELFAKSVRSVQRGKEIFDTIVENHNTPLFIHPTSSIGDTYLGQLLLQEYVKEHKLDWWVNVALDTNGNRGIISMFNSKLNFFLEKEEIDCLMQFSSFINMNDGRIKILSNYLPYSAQYGNITNYHNINLLDNFKYGTFCLPTNVIPKHPTKLYHSKEIDEYVEKMFIEHDLIEGRTVMLFPSAKTVSGLRESFWNKLCNYLIGKGYMVCVNKVDLCVEIKNAKLIDCKLEAIREFVEKAGGFVALRSGMCDVISGTIAKKIILYPNRIRGYGTLFQYFSVNQMGLCQDATEFVFEDNEDELLNNIQGVI